MPHQPLAIDLKPPELVLSTSKSAALDGHTRYTVVRGNADLCKAVCDDLMARKSVQFQPNDVLITTGEQMAIYEALLSICNEYDDVLVPTPAWGSYRDLVR